MNFHEIFSQVKNSLSSLSQIDYSILNQSIHQLEQQFSHHPYDIKIVCLLAILYREQNNSEQGMTILQNWRKQTQNTCTKQDLAMRATCIAYFYIEEENKECGSKYLRFALKQGESFAETYYGYGQYLFKQKQYKKACEMYQQAYIQEKSNL